MTDSKALREKLCAMVAEKVYESAPHLGGGVSTVDIYEAVALDLLREKEEREMPGTADALKRCVWSVDDDGIWTATCGEVEWCFNDGGPVENKVKHCCGCGHPVQVKQDEEK